MFYRNIFSNDIYYLYKHPIYIVKDRQLAEWYQILANFSPSSLIFQTVVCSESVELTECRDPWRNGPILGQEMHKICLEYLVILKDKWVIVTGGFMSNRGLQLPKMGWYLQ